jgi:hypothetical protein
MAVAAHPAGTPRRLANLQVQPRQLGGFVTVGELRVRRMLQHRNS